MENRTPSACLRGRFPTMGTRWPVPVSPGVTLVEDGSAFTRAPPLGFEPRSTPLTAECTTVVLRRNEETLGASCRSSGCQRARPRAGWMGVRDSNPDERCQKPLSYRWMNSQFCWWVARELNPADHCLRGRCISLMLATRRAGGIRTPISSGKSRVSLPLDHDPLLRIASVSSCSWWSRVELNHLVQRPDVYSVSRLPGTNPGSRNEEGHLVSRAAFVIH